MSEDMRKDLEGTMPAPAITIEEMQQLVAMFNWAQTTPDVQTITHRALKQFNMDDGAYKVVHRVGAELWLQIESGSRWASVLGKGDTVLGAMADFSIKFAAIKK